MCDVSQSRSGGVELQVVQMHVDLEIIQFLETQQILSQQMVVAVVEDQEHLVLQEMVTLVVLEEVLQEQVQQVQQLKETYQVFRVQVLVMLVVHHNQVTQE